MRSDRQLDELIDAALPGYSDAEPGPGLEQRIIARSLAERLRHKRFAWSWTLALPAMVCLLVFLLLNGRQSSPSKIIENTAKSASTTSDQGDARGVSRIQAPSIPRVAAGP